MKNLIEAFYRSIQSGEPPPIPYREILGTAVVMDEIFRQLNGNQPEVPLHSEAIRPSMAYSGDRS